MLKLRNHKDICYLFESYRRTIYWTLFYCHEHDNLRRETIFHIARLPVQVAQPCHAPRYSTPKNNNAPDKRRIVFEPQRRAWRRDSVTWFYAGIGTDLVTELLAYLVAGAGTAGAGAGAAGTALPAGSVGTSAGAVCTGVVTGIPAAGAWARPITPALSPPLRSLPM